MLPSPASSLEHLKKIADFEPSALKSIEKAMGDSRTDKELHGSALPHCFILFCILLERLLFFSFSSASG